MSVCPVILWVAACGVSVGTGNGIKVGSSSENLTYNLTENGCSTGEQNFDSTDKLCDALEDESLNHGCAIDLRKSQFQQQCSGKTWRVTHIGPVPCGSASCDGGTQYCLTSYLGRSNTPAVTPECVAVPSGFDYETVDSTCTLLVKDAQRVFAGADNCSQTTFCTKKSGGNGFSLTCEAH